MAKFPDKDYGSSLNRNKGEGAGRSGAIKETFFHNEKIHKEA